jgi:hypothetical protein
MSTKPMGVRLSLLFGVAMTATACTAARPATGSGPANVFDTTVRSTSLPEPEFFPPLAREILHRRMNRHGEDMLALVSSILMLNHQVSETLATEIVREPLLGRPTPADPDTLNVQLPARFFGLQDELKDRARSVAQAAQGKHNQKLVQSLGRLIETCVSCHALYLDESVTTSGNADAAKWPQSQTLHQP